MLFNNMILIKKFSATTNFVFLTIICRLLKNKAKTLPLDGAKRILVAGDAADNIGKQSGGWSITWQGTNNTNDDFPGGTSIFDGIKQHAEQAGGEAV